MVDVSTGSTGGSITVTGGSQITSITATSDTTQYWSKQSEKYAEESKLARNDILNHKDEIIGEVTAEGEKQKEILETTGQLYVDEAKNWANKLGDTVDGVEYSAKHYAELTADRAESAITDIQTQEDLSLSVINDLTNTSKTEITTATQNGKNEMQNIYEQFQEQVDSGALMFNNPNSLLDVKWSDKKINNLSWLISQGQSNSGAVYVDVYNLLVKEYGNATDETETIGSTTITYRCGTETGIKITTDKAAYDAILSATGTAWYYVLDGENQAFYLPQTNGFLQAGEGGKFTTAGLPNITGSIMLADNIAVNPSGTSEGADKVSGVGAFSTVRTTRNTVEVQNYNIISKPYNGNLDFSAAKSNSIYGNSNTVQPNAVNGYLYFYVGEAIQNANLIDAGRIQEQLSKKLDISTFQGNALQKSQKEEITNWSFPSNTKYTNLAVGIPGSQYTAPADGWYSLWTEAGSQNAFIHLFTNTLSVIQTHGSGAVGALSATLPIKRGDNMILNYQDLINTSRFYFVYAQGE